MICKKLLIAIFYYELKVSPEDHPVLITEPALNHKSNREKLAQIMSENFGVPSLCNVTDAILSLFEADKSCRFWVRYN